MSLQELLEKPICYVTFNTTDNLLRCSKCRCAWYSSKEEQKKHWPTHKVVCKKPNYKIISKLDGLQCCKILSDTITAMPDHNTAGILQQLYSLVRQEWQKPKSARSKFGTSEEFFHLGCQFRGWTRTYGHVDAKPTLDAYYPLVWACPGMPQFLHFADLLSVSHHKLMKKYPDGLLNDTEVDDIDIYADDTEQTGEDLSTFVILFLIRSCVDAPVDLIPATTHDGRGRWRIPDASDGFYGAAATCRIGEIFSDAVIRQSAKKAMYPIPGFVLNIAENLPNVLLRLLNMGVFGGIIEWADQDYSLQTMKIIANMGKTELSSLTKETNIQIIELCCNALNRDGGAHWYSNDDNKDFKIYDLCIEIAGKVMLNSTDGTALLREGMNRRTEYEPRDWSQIDHASRRIVLAYLHDKILENGGNKFLSISFLKKSLKKWKKVKYSEQIEYARKVMDSEPFEKWHAKVVEVKDYCYRLYQKKKNEEKGGGSRWSNKVIGA